MGAECIILRLRSRETSRVWNSCLLRMNIGTFRPRARVAYALILLAAVVFEATNSTMDEFDAFENYAPVDEIQSMVEPKTEDQIKGAGSAFSTTAKMIQTKAQSEIQAKQIKKLSTKLAKQRGAVLKIDEKTIKRNKERLSKLAAEHAARL